MMDEGEKEREDMTAHPRIVCIIVHNNRMAEHHIRMEDSTFRKVPRLIDRWISR